MSEERKVVSVLFCDLVGFTAASEQTDPEDVRARIRPYHQRLREVIEWFGGTVEKFVGDAVMAVFGALVAHEDDAERAVRSGLRILEAIGALNEAEPGLSLQVRVGINTGEAVVALGARPEQGESLVTGDVVNTASRIESAAPVDGVAVGELTYRTTSHIFEYAPLEPVSVKGKAEPLALWRPKAVRLRFGRDVGEYTTPLVGRELEKTLLVGTFERAMQQRSVQLVTIVGEPGVGKSRMVAELFVHMDAKPELIRWRQGRCLPYGEGITFWALGEIVKSEAAILESDSAEVAAEKLDAALSPEEPERRWLLQRLGPLVGVEAAAPAERQESFTAWRRFFEGLAAVRGTVLVFDDLHWADEALLAFLEHLAEWSQDVPLLLLCAARPELFERRAGWGAGLRNAHTINLPPLSDTETGELVSNLVSQVALGQELEHAIVERAGGNPLYAEEFVRLIADRGFDPTEGRLAERALPESVQALISARLDTLSPERKSLLQDAAVLGKVFWAGAVAEMGARDVGEVELTLHELARKELVRPGRTSSMEGEAEYAFSHLLVRDVAYSQIPRAERARRHHAAAAWIERLGGERVEDLAEVLAHHYLQALELAEAAGNAKQAQELAAPARRFLALAGERALGLDTVQAETRLARALGLTPEGHPDRPEILVRWADAVFQSGRPREAAEALDEALATLRSRSEVEAVARALELRSTIALRLGDGRYVALAAEAVELLEGRDPGPALVAAYSQLANAHAIAGSYTEAIAAAERAAMVAETLDLPEPARALSYRGFARFYLGDPDGLAEMERALALLLEQGAGQHAAQVMNNLALCRWALEGPAPSLAGLERAIGFCAGRGLAYVGRALETMCPGLLVELGRTEEALGRSDQLAVTLEALGVKHLLIELHSAELLVRLAQGEVDAAPGTAEWLVQAAREVGSADSVVQGLGAAAARLPERSTELLAELDEAAGARETTYFARQLPGMVRTALLAGHRALAERLARGFELDYPLQGLALCSARAQLAEYAGDHSNAASLYADAVAGWQEFGNQPETAYALLGKGRSLRAVGDPAAEYPLVEARELFASMGYEPALAETEALLAEQQAAAP